MTSTPAANSSSAIFGVMPRPPAAFSALTTTKVGSWSARSLGSRPSSVRRPSPPTTSPTKRIFTTGHTLAQSRERRMTPTANRGSRPARGRAAAVAAAPVVVPRWVQLVMLPIGVLALWVVARAAGPVLLIFIAAGIVALILNPLVTFFQRAPALPRPGRSRPSTSASSAFLGTAGYLLANPIADQAQSFQQRRAGDHRRREPEPRRPAELARRQGHQPQGQGPGRDRAADAAGQGRRRHERHRVLRRRPREDGS